MNSFEDVPLRSSDVTRPQSTSKVHNFFHSALRKTFMRKKRRHTTPVKEVDLKSNISSPLDVSKVSEEDVSFGRDSIQCCPFDISGYGEFILMDEFVVRRPKKMTLMAFLFEKIIIFTKKEPHEVSYYYMGNLHMNQIKIEPPKKNPKILELEDHWATLRFHKVTIVSLEAASEYIQLQWRRAIERCLWGQLMKAKRDAGFVN